MKIDAEITSGTAPAYFCGIATVFSMLSVFIFLHIEIHLKHKMKETTEEKHEKCIQCHKMQHKLEKKVYVFKLLVVVIIKCYKKNSRCQVFSV